MSVVSVETAMKAIVDRFGYGIETSLGVFDGGSNFWAITDTSDDVSFENTVSNWDASNLDTALINGTIFTSTKIVTFLQNINTYMSSYFGATSYPTLNDYLAASKFRVPYRFAEMYAACFGEAARIAPQHVFSQGILPASGVADDAGMLNLATVTAGTAAIVDAIDFIKTIGSIILTINTGGVAAGGTFNVKTQDGAAKAVAATLTESSNAYNIVGIASVSTNYTAGDTTVVVGATETNAFADEDYIMIVGSGPAVEIAQIDSITNGTTLVLKTGLKYNHTNSSKIYPIYKSLESITSASGTFKVYARPDRILAL